MGFLEDMEKMVRQESGINKPQDPAKLREALEIFRAENKFSVGDIVMWKPGMKNRKSVGPLIVVEVLDAPVFSGKDDEIGSPLFREPLDIVCGMIGANDGEFMAYHYDSRRFMHYKEE